MFKSVSLALATVVATASIASADSSNISNFVQQQNSNGLIELGTVTAADQGVIDIYDYHRGVQGELLGSETVNAGANSDVKLVIPTPTTNAIAVLTVNGQVVDTQELDFN